MKGRTMTIPCGGAVRQRRERRLMNDAMMVLGMRDEERKMVSRRKKRARYLVCRRTGVRREYSRV